MCTLFYTIRRRWSVDSVDRSRCRGCKLCRRCRRSRRCCRFLLHDKSLVSLSLLSSALFFVTKLIAISQYSPGCPWVAFSCFVLSSHATSFILLSKCRDGERAAKLVRLQASLWHWKNYKRKRRAKAKTPIKILRVGRGTVLPCTSLSRLVLYIPHT